MTATAPRLATSTLALAALLLCGCSVLQPQPDLARFFTLTPLAAPPPPAAEAAGRREVTYVLGPIKLPAYLDRNEIATRLSPTQITYSPVNRWAGSLRANVTAVLLQDLSELLHTDRIITYPGPGAASADYRIEVQLLNFDHDAGGECRLTALWSVQKINASRPLLLRRSSFTRRAASAVTADVVAALSAALGDLSGEIAAAVGALPPPATDP